MRYHKAAFEHDIRSYHSWYSFGESDEEDPEILWDIVLNIILEFSDLHYPMRG